MALEEKIILWAVIGILSLGVARAVLEIKKQSALRQGVRAILRDRILTTYNYFRKKGNVPFTAVENMSNMYSAYHSLGGNGPITKVYKQFLELPQNNNDDRYEGRDI